MVNSLKRLNKIQVLSLVLLVVSFIMFCLGINNSSNFFWVCLGLNMYGYLIFIVKWSKEGKTGNRRIDKNYDKNLTRKSSEFIFFMVIAYYLIICICVIADFWIQDFMYQFGTILGLFSIAIIWNFLSLAIVDRTSKEVELILKGGKNNGS
jgi:hypothetical protein